MDDAVPESAETDIITLGTPVNAAPGATTAETITILDNDLFHFYLPTLIK